MPNFYSNLYDDRRLDEMLCIEDQLKLILAIKRIIPKSVRSLATADQYLIEVFLERWLELIPDARYKKHVFEIINQDLNFEESNSRHLCEIINLLPRICNGDYRELRIDLLLNRVKKALQTCDLATSARLINGLAQCGFGFRQCAELSEITDVIINGALAEFNNIQNTQAKIRGARSLSFLFSGLMNLGLLNPDIIRSDKMVRAFESIVDFTTRSEYSQISRNAANAFFELIFFCRKVFEFDPLTEGSNATKRLEEGLKRYFNSKQVTSFGDDPTISKSQEQVKKILVKYLEKISVWSAIKNGDSGDIEIGDFIVKSECCMAKIAGVLFKPSDLVVTNRDGKIIMALEVDGDKHHNLYVSGEEITGKTATRNAVLGGASQDRLIVVDVREIEAFKSNPNSVLEGKGFRSDVGLVEIPKIEIEVVQQDDVIEYEEVVADSGITVAAGYGEEKEVVAPEEDELPSRPVSVFKAVRKSGKKTKPVKKPAKQKEVASEPLALLKMVRNKDSEAVENFLHNSSLPPERKSTILNDRIKEEVMDGRTVETTLLSVAIQNNDLETALVLIESGAVVQRGDIDFIEKASDEMLMLVRFFIPEYFFDPKKCKPITSIRDRIKKLLRDKSDKKDLRDVVFAYNAICGRHIDQRGGIFLADLYEEGGVAALRLFFAKNNGDLPPQVMCYYIKKGDFDLLEFAHKKLKIDLNQLSRGFSYLAGAVLHDHVDIVQYLMKNSAKFVTQSIERPDLVTYAAYYGAIDVLKYFIYDRKLEEIYDGYNVDETTGIQVAAQYGDTRPEELSAEIKDKFHKILRILCENIPDHFKDRNYMNTPCLVNKKLTNPLLTTCENDDAIAAKILLKHGANPNIGYEIFGCHFLSFCIKERKSLELMQVLCDYGADVSDIDLEDIFKENLETIVEDSTSRLSEYGTDVIKLLTDHGARYNGNISQLKELCEPSNEVEDPLAGAFLEQLDLGIG